MEYGVRLSSPGELPGDPREICSESWGEFLPPGTLRALYFGSEFCEDSLPTVKEAAAFCRLARETGLEAVLLTPVVTVRGLHRLDKLLGDLEKCGWLPATVFNDWGVLRLLQGSHPAVERRAGRLINRALRDPRLADQSPPAPSANSGRGTRLRLLLKRCGVGALETDADLEGSYLGDGTEGLQRVLHFPYVFAASGRNCLIKAEGEDAGHCFTKGLGRVCDAPCRGHFHEVQRPDTSRPIWRAGNTLFYEVHRAWAEMHLVQADRIVLHERPMP